MFSILGSDRSDRRGMKRLRNTPLARTMLGSLLCLGPAPAAESQPDKVPTLPVPLTDVTPAINGKLEEPCWQNAARTGPLKDTHGKPGEPPTEALILCDADPLYVAFRCAGAANVTGAPPAGAPAEKMEFAALRKLVGVFGSYGNLDCPGQGSKFPHPELPFGTISALSVWQDRLFAVDVLNRRIVKCRIVYGPAE